jgi:glycosyltransferase involved in cell wall biosynthesis
MMAPSCSSAASTVAPGDGQRIRLIIQQPTLAKYRVPVFQELARREQIALKLVYGSRPDLPNAEADGFDAETAPLHWYQIAGRSIFWHTPQWRYATWRTTDVLLLTWNVRYLSLLPALLRARAQGVPTILWGHGYSKQERAWRATTRSGVARLATALLFYNHSAADRYQEAGWNAKQVFVAPNCLDQQPIDAARRSWLARADQLHQFRVAQRLGDGPVILYVSRLDPTNRLDLLVEATGSLARHYPGLTIVMIGKGDAERRRLERLADRRGIGDRLRMVGPVYDEMELAPWFLSANLFCYPANIGLSLLHAFGYGLPVVTSDRTSAQNPEIEALRNGENGLFYRDGDADALAGAIRGILDQPQRAERMAEAALATVHDEYTLVKMVDGMEAAVRYCWEKSHRKPHSDVP